MPMKIAADTEQFTEGSEGFALHAKIVNVTPAMAKHLLASCEFPRQRNLRPNNVDRLAGEMSRGWYILGTALHFAVYPNGDQQLLNGMHSLNAVVQIGIGMPFTFIFHPVDSLDQAGHIYSRLDIHRQRTWQDAYKAAGFEERAGFNSVWVQTFGAAARAMLNRFDMAGGRDNQLSSSRELTLRIFEEYLPIAQKYIGLLDDQGGRRARPFRRGGVMAVALETLRYQPEKAAEFWRGASQDDGLKARDPRKVLVEYIRRAFATTAQVRRLQAHAAALCWNSYFADGTMTNIWPSTVQTVIIDGTPWNGSYTPFTELLDSLTPKQIPVEYEDFQTGLQYTAADERLPVTTYTGPKKERAKLVMKKGKAGIEAKE